MPTLLRVWRAGELALEIDVDGTGEVPGGVLAPRIHGAELPADVEQDQVGGRAEELTQRVDRDQRGGGHIRHDKHPVPPAEDLIADGTLTRARVSSQRAIGYTTHMQAQQLKDELIDLERRGWEALCKQTGDEFYGSLMTAEAVMVLANGQVMDRDAVMRALAEAPPWASFELEDSRVVPIGDGSAALVYRATAARDPDSPPFECVMTSVYVADGDDWRLALYQQTPINDAG